MKKQKSFSLSVTVLSLLVLVSVVFTGASRNTLETQPQRNAVNGGDRQMISPNDQEVSYSQESMNEESLVQQESANPVPTKAGRSVSQDPKTSFKQRVAEKILVRKIRKLDKKSNRNGLDSGKSQLVALLLCIFIGVLGIHRFYLGYIGIGVIQLLTGGLCGIWTLIDLIMIIVGSLKPKGGAYAETF
jgi:hypothetical protein